MSLQSFETVRRSSLRFSLGTFLSRVTGLAREQMTAFYFGASPEIAAFFMAYRFALLFRRFFAEGAFLGGFTPYYLQAKGESPEKAASFFRDFTISLLGVVFLGMIALEAGLLCFMQAGGELALVWQLTALMLPSLLFAFLYMSSSALLQSERIFFMPGAAPLMFNLVFIGAVVLSRWSPSSWVSYVLAIGVTFGFFLQWLLLVPILLTSCKSLFSVIRWRSVSLFPHEVRNVLSALGLTFLGIGASQINSAMDALFARASSLSGPAYMHYAARLYQMPLSLVGIAFASALLPMLTQALQETQRDTFYALWRKTLFKVFVFAMPLSMGLIVLGVSGLNLVYGRGGFVAEAVWESTYCLWGYAVGLVPSIWVLILTTGYSARRDFRTPLKAALCAMGVNVCLNGLLVWVGTTHVGWMAFTTSLASCINAGLLWRGLSIEDRTALWESSRHAYVRIVCATLCGAGVSLYCDAIPAVLPTHFVQQGVAFLLAAARYSMALYFFAWLFKAELPNPFQRRSKEGERREGSILGSTSQEEAPGGDRSEVL